MRRSSARGDRSRVKTRPAITSRARRCRVHRIPSRVSDDHDTPLCWGGTAGNKPVIWVKRKAGYFRLGGWTAKSLICPSRGVWSNASPGAREHFCPSDFIVLVSGDTPSQLAGPGSLPDQVRLFSPQGRACSPRQGRVGWFSQPSRCLRRGCISSITPGETAAAAGAGYRDIDLRAARRSPQDKMAHRGAADRSAGAARGLLGLRRPRTIFRQC